jgi:hypothetical protein
VSKRAKLFVPFLLTLLFLLSFHSPVSAANYELDQGWNFFTLSTDPMTTTLDVVLSSVLDDVVIVWGFDNATKRWLRFMPNPPSDAPNTLATIVAGKGYWIYMAQSAILSLTGGLPYLQYITMHEGWNLIGYVWNDNTSVQSALGNNISYKWDSLWTWQGSQWSGRHQYLQLSGIPLIETFRYGHAYWMKIRQGYATAQWWNDYMGPVAIYLNPVDMINTPVTTQITAGFHEPVDPASVIQARFTLKDDAGNPVAGTVSVDGSSVIFTPSVNLAYSTNYHVSVKKGVVRDFAGNPSQYDSDWQFRTGPAPGSHPTVVSVTPASGATNVPNTFEISAVFSEYMDCATINSSTISVTSDGVNLCGYAGCMDKTVTFTGCFYYKDYSTTYTVHISKDVQDVGGNRMGEDYQWSFTTGKDPAKAATGIWYGTLSSGQLGTQDMYGIIAENGESRFFTLDDVILAGYFYQTGTTFASNNMFAFTDLGIFGISINGTAVAETSATGDYWGYYDSGSFSLTYDPIYERDSSLQLVQGNWGASDQDFSMNITVAGNGGFTGSSSDGCTYAGSIGIIDTRYNAYSINISITCPAPYDPLNGFYTGLVTLDDTTALNDTARIIFSYFDGMSGSAVALFLQKN